MADDSSHSEQTAPDEDAPLPERAVDRAETLTRRARSAIDENERDAYLEERAQLLSAHGYDARVREGDTGATLVLYPAEWLEAGTIQLDRVEDTDRAIERPISGPGSDADWETVDGHNRAIAARVRERHGEVHGETAAALADFASNHYAKPIEDVTPAEREEFRSEYFPRNAWPSELQCERVSESIRLAVEIADEL
jgi:hypothetical protein